MIFSFSPQPRKIFRVVDSPFQHNFDVSLHQIFHTASWSHANRPHCISAVLYEVNIITTDPNHCTVKMQWHRLGSNGRCVIYLRCISGAFLLWPILFSDKYMKISITLQQPRHKEQSAKNNQSLHGQSTDLVHMLSATCRHNNSINLKKYKTMV